MPDRARSANFGQRVLSPGAVLLVALVGAGAARGADESLFRERIAPILATRCVRCHDETSHKGGLSLATEAGLRKGGKSGAAIVAGNADDSLLLEKVSGDPPEMPPKDAPLTKTEIDAIRGWIASGAHWPADLVLRDQGFAGQRWWAFEPLAIPRVPSLSATERARSPIDAFVLDTIRRQQLVPNPEADRRTLIRRLYFDLLGLPPSPEEVASFLSDRSPAAYESLVDRLLASPHYGERWGRYWLDIVHYGDTHGYDKDKRRDHAWAYRDYVIGAFNGDMPYGQFIREQLAGDVLYPGKGRGAIATGFIAAGPWDFVGHTELREGTIDKLKTRVLDRDDMVSSTMSTFASLTVHCARCHDHKFDPISQADYYGLQAVFAGVDRGDRPCETAEIAAKRRKLEKRRAVLAARVQELDRTIAKSTSPAITDLDAQIATHKRTLEGLPRPAPGRASPTNGYHSAIEPRADATAWVQVDLGSPVPIREIRLIPARPTDFPDTPGFGFPVEFSVEIANEASMANAERVAAVSRGDRENVADEPFVIPLSGQTARFVRVTATRLWKRLDDYVFALAELEVISGGANKARGARVTAYDSIEAGRWARANLVDGFDSRHARPPAADVAAQARNAARLQLRTLELEREVQKAKLVDQALYDERRSLVDSIKAVEKELHELARESVVYGIQSHSPRPIAVLKRGEVDQPGPVAVPGALGCLSGHIGTFTIKDPNDEGSRRAALADWLASPANALAWRSIANRLWQYHFGRGIVETPNDFGRNGAKPTHPELLDWLATQLRDRGQSFKALHRMIVCSAVYRQASTDNAACASIDADNRYLWRQNRRRLDAESVRDSILSVAGTLDLRMGGPGFELFRFKDDHSPTYDHTDPSKVDHPSARRRTVYRFVVRSVPNPFMEALDCADPNLNTPVRSQTLTALQALALWNDLFIINQSRAFARRLEQSTAVLNERVIEAFRLALGRDPSEFERESLTAYAAKHGLDQACRLLLNTSEFVFVD